MSKKETSPVKPIPPESVETSSQFDPNEIYTKGLIAGQLQLLPVIYEEVMRLADELIDSPQTAEYYKGASQLRIDIQKLLRKLDSQLKGEINNND